MRAVRSVHRYAIAALAALAVATIAHADPVKDATGRIVKAGDVKRIVSIGGSVTEILYALGMDQHVVAIDTTSHYPPDAAKDKANVGYMRQLAAEGVLGLRPTLILAIDGSGPKETLAVLNAAGVPMILVPDSYTGEGIIEKIRVIAQAVGVAARGECVIARVRADLDALRQVETAIVKRKRVLFVLSFVNGRALAAGRNTAADGIVRMAGGVNAITEYDSYKPLTDEAVIAANPDMVLAMARGGPAPLTADVVFAHAAFTATKAAATPAFVAMEGLYLLGFGPRSARAARDLAVALHPELKRDLLPSERAAAEPCRE